MMEIPLFVICGFLESGKSSFIIDSVKKDGLITRYSVRKTLSKKMTTFYCGA